VGEEKLRYNSGQIWYNLFQYFWTRDSQQRGKILVTNLQTVSQRVGTQSWKLRQYTAKIKYVSFPVEGPANSKRNYSTVSRNSRVIIFLSNHLLVPLRCYLYFYPSVHEVVSLYSVNYEICTSSQSKFFRSATLHVRNIFWNFHFEEVTQKIM